MKMTVEKAQVFLIDYKLRIIGLRMEKQIILNYNETLMKITARQCYRIAKDGLKRIKDDKV